MTIKLICTKIPDEVRSLLLLSKKEPILHATNTLNDPNMRVLADVWYEYIEPEKERGTCPICLENIRTNFRQMHSTLVQLEEEYQKLNLL